MLIFGGPGKHLVAFPLAFSFLRSPWLGMHGIVSHFSTEGSSEDDATVWVLGKLALLAHDDVVAWKMIPLGE